jgi:hypothetical protein
MNHVIRWILVMPVAYLGYYIAMISGMAGLALAESFCPPDEVISGMCMAEFMRQIEKFLFVLFPGFAAVLVVLLPSLVAPSRKAAVAVTFFAAGSVIAIFLGVSLEEWVILAVTLACGGVTTWAVHQHQKRLQNSRKKYSAM